MDKATENKIQEQQEKLKQLQQKNLPENVKKSISEKQKYLTKPLKK